MATQRIERQLEHLKALRTQPVSDSSLKELKKSFADRSNILIAKAAAIAAEWHAQSLLPDVLAAFNRLFIKAAEADPQCGGKIELAKCLNELGHAESEAFIHGLEHHQFEATWGGKTDTASPLRSTCALALVQCTDIPRHEIILHLVNALTEAEATVRADAARALEQMNGRDIALLLRLKARCGDKEPRVTGQILESVLALEGASAIPFVTAFLRNPDQEVSEEAALALGAARLPESVDALIEAWKSPFAFHQKSVLLRAISASRLDTALDFLFEQIKTGEREEAQDALWALQLHRDSLEIVQRISDTISKRVELQPLFRQIYSQPS